VPGDGTAEGEASGAVAGGAGGPGSSGGTATSAAMVAAATTESHMGKRLLKRYVPFHNARAAPPVTGVQAAVEGGRSRASVRRWWVLAALLLLAGCREVRVKTYAQGTRR